MHKRKAAFDSLRAAGFNGEAGPGPDRSEAGYGSLGTLPSPATERNEKFAQCVDGVGIFLAFMTIIGSLLFGLRAWLPHTAQ